MHIKQETTITNIKCTTNNLQLQTIQKVNDEWIWWKMMRFLMFFIFSLPFFVDFPSFCSSEMKSLLLLPYFLSFNTKRFMKIFLSNHLIRWLMNVYVSIVFPVPWTRKTHFATQIIRGGKRTRFTHTGIRSRLQWSEIEADVTGNLT